MPAKSTNLVALDPTIAGRLARLVHEGTDGGEELVTFCLDVLQGKVNEDHIDKNGNVIWKGPSIKDRVKCVEILFDRLAGKAKESHEIQISPPVDRSYLESLSDEKLKEISRLLKSGGNGGPGSSDRRYLGGKASATVIDVLPTPSDPSSE